MHEPTQSHKNENSNAPTVINDVTSPGHSSVAYNPQDIASQGNPVISNPEIEQHKNRKKKHSKLKSVLSTISILLLAPVIAFTLTAFVFQSYEVDGPSMEKTLLNHDRLIVTKSGKTWAKLTGSNYIPKRGEIIVFSQDEGIISGSVKTRQLIKRVVGLPGDRVVLADGHITIYNNDHPKGFNPDKDVEWAGVIGVSNGQPFDKVLAEDEIYVCGDNRPNSYDSRSFGPIKSERIIGKLSYRIYPFGSSKSF